MQSVAAPLWREILLLLLCIALGVGGVGTCIVREGNSARATIDRQKQEQRVLLLRDWEIVAEGPGSYRVLRSRLNGRCYVVRQNNTRWEGEIPCRPQ